MKIIEKWFMKKASELDTDIVSTAFVITYLFLLAMFMLTYIMFAVKAFS